jgi:WD40 repeat protein
MPQNTLLRHLKEHSASKLAWAGSFEGDKLVTTSENEIIVWDLTCAGPPPTPVTASDFKPITAGNIENLKLAHNFTEGNMVAFATKSNFFIMGTKVYSLADMKPISDFGENQIDENMGSAISPDGKYLALPNYEGKLLIWDVANNYPMQALEGCAFMPIFLPDGRLVARNVINIDQEACIWKDLHGTVKKISYPHGFEDLVSLPSGVYLSTHGYSGKFGLKDLFAKGVDATYLFSDHMESEVFSPNGKFLAAINSNDYTYWVFDAAKQSLEKQFSQLFSYAAFSYDEKLMAAMSISDHLLKVYGTKDWEPLFELQAESDVNKLVFSPDGHYLVLSGGGKAQFWSVDGK